MYVVEHLVRMNTHLGTTTAVEAWTRVSLAVSLVLVVRTIKEYVTTHYDWQAVAVVWTLEVCVWAGRESGVGLCIGACCSSLRGEGSVNDQANIVHVDHSRGR
jgi:hypothetical protein